MAVGTDQLIVELDGLTKTYGDVVAVDRVDLGVRPGEIFGILGGNGAGKTTSVECAQGLRKPDAGTVRVLGHDPIADRGALSGRVGSQLQVANLPDRMRVGEAVGLFAADHDRRRQVIDKWDLAPIERRPFGKLSGGQRQRLFLALALINSPEVVFLDELTQGLDPSARREVWALVEQVRDQGTTVVLVTHFAEEAERLCDRVAVMVGGHVVDTGTPAELTARYGDGAVVTFDGDAADVDWVRRVPLVAHADWQRGVVTARGPSPMIAHLGASMVERRAVPAALRVDHPSLETALVQLIDAGANRTVQAEDHTR